MREKRRRRFFLKNTAPNLAGAELQELVRAAVEGNGGRITTSQNQAARGRRALRQIGVNVQFFATTPDLQKILYALETQQPYLVVENITLRPLNAFRGFRPAAGQEPEINVQLDVAGFAFTEAGRRNSDGRRDERNPRCGCAPRSGGLCRCCSRLRCSRGRPISAARDPQAPAPGRADSGRAGGRVAAAGVRDCRRHRRAHGDGAADAVQSDAASGAACSSATPRNRGCSAASSR